MLAIMADQSARVITVDSVVDELVAHFYLSGLASHSPSSTSYRSARGSFGS